MSLKVGGEKVDVKELALFLHDECSESFDLQYQLVGTSARVCMPLII